MLTQNSVNNIKILKRFHQVKKLQQLKLTSNMKYGVTRRKKEKRKT